MENVWKCPKCGRTFKKEGQSHYCGKAPTTVAEYIEAQDAELRPYLIEVRDAIRRALPDVTETISWSMPTYKDRQNLIHFAASKNHIGIYPGDEAVAVFSERLSEYDTSKGTIRIPYQHPLPLKLIQDIANWCKQRQEEVTMPAAKKTTTTGKSKDEILDVLKEDIKKEAKKFGLGK